MRIKFMSRNAVLVIISLAALAVGSAALGLALANRLSEDERGPVAYYSQVEVGRGGKGRFEPAPGIKPGFARPPSRVGRSPYARGPWDRIADGKHGARSPSRADARVSSGMVIAIGEVTGVSDDTLSVATILGNNVDIALRESIEVDGVSVGGSVVVMAERTADGLVARWVRPIAQLGELGDRAWLRPAVAS